ncbi:MAG: terpene cyclase/mutase family protein, partial [Verrucomicrobiales bacterium]|nr:terpene cyclase/mutase family protein [Verrucomicrobiales bacterium]
TALCVSALLELPQEQIRPGVAPSLELGEAFLLEELPKVRRGSADAIYNVWTHAYGLQALVKMHAEAGQKGDTERQREIRRVALTQIDLLGRYESVNGGWGYYDFEVGSKRPASSAISFTTATVLIAFHEVETLPGIDVPDAMVKRAIDSINRQKKPDHSYLYGEYLKWQPVRGINTAGGSLGRSQACNLALRLWGDTGITDDLVVEWLHRLRDRNGWLDMGRKRPVPHESWMQVAAYFYYYGHYYASQCLELLPVEQRPPLQSDLAAILLARQEKDGSWWDFPFYDYHQPYGTAFALMTLQRCLPAGK